MALRGWGKVDFMQLTCFVKAYEFGSFSKAAAHLYLAQPTLTYRISSLEKELGCELFKRTKHGVVPTAAADAAVAVARTLLDGQQEFIETARRAAGVNAIRIRIGFNRYTNSARLNEAIAAFEAAHPDISVERDLGYVDDPDASVLSGTHDLVFLYDYDGGSHTPLTFAQTGESTYYVVMRASNPLAAKSTLTIDDLAGAVVLAPERYVSTKFMVPSAEALRRAGATVRCCPDNDWLLLTIRSSDAVGIYPLSTPEAGAGLTRRALSDQPPLIDGVLFSSATISHEARALMDTIVSIMRPAQQ